LGQARPAVRQPILGADQGDLAAEAAIPQRGRRARARERRPHDHEPIRRHGPLVLLGRHWTPDRLACPRLARPAARRGQFVRGPRPAAGRRTITAGSSPSQARRPSTVPDRIRAVRGSSPLTWVVMRATRRSPGRASRKPMYRVETCTVKGPSPTPVRTSGYSPVAPAGTSTSQRCRPRLEVSEPNTWLTSTSSERNPAETRPSGSCSSGTTGPVDSIVSVLVPATKGSGVIGQPVRAHTRWPAIRTASLWPRRLSIVRVPRRVQQTKPSGARSAP